MSKPRPRRERLEKLLGLAKVYRGWSQRELARELERDPHNLVPDGGVPRLDLVLRLSEALDWPVENVVTDLCGPARQGDGGEPRGAARPLNLEAFAQLSAGQYQAAIDTCSRVIDGGFAAPDTAYALHVQANALEGLGRYSSAIDAVRRALQLVEPCSIEGLSSRCLLANLHYSLGSIQEAEGLASSIIVEASDVASGDPRQHHAGYARYVRGSCHRVMAGAQPSHRAWHARKAQEDLRLASQILDRYQDWSGNANDAATSQICRGGCLEVTVMLGEREPEAALSEFEWALEDPHASDRTAPWWQECRAWWCLFACNVALRHLSDDARLERVLAVFTNKADELAEALGHWALREQIWTIEHLRRRARESAGDVHAEPWVLDGDELRVLAGTMGRFPIFRETGWQILQKVRLPGDEP